MFGSTDDLRENYQKVEIKSPTDSPLSIYRCAISEVFGRIIMRYSSSTQFERK